MIHQRILRVKGRASALFHQNRVAESADVVRSMAVPKTAQNAGKQSPFAR